MTPPEVATLNWTWPLARMTSTLPVGTDTAATEVVGRSPGRSPGRITGGRAV